MFEQVNPMLVILKNKDAKLSLQDEITVLDMVNLNATHPQDTFGIDLDYINTKATSGIELDEEELDTILSSLTLVNNPVYISEAGKTCMEMNGHVIEEI